MAVKQLTSQQTDSDGTNLGQSTTDKIGAFGVTPVVQPAHTDQAAITAGATTTACNNLVIQLRLALLNLGWIKGSN
jgi:hypothetical protein